MGLFDSFFKQTNNSNYVFDYDTLLGLTSSPNITFRNAKGEFLKIYIHEGFIPPSDIPEEFLSDKDLAIEEEFNIRYNISYGIISLAIIEYLIKKRTGNYQNLTNVEKVKKFVYSNILKLRGQIISRNLLIKTILMKFDDEASIEDNDDNCLQFTERISELAAEIKNHFENGTDFIKISQYFGMQMGKVLPILIDHKFIREESFVRKMTEKICQYMEAYCFVSRW